MLEEVYCLVVDEGRYRVCLKSVHEFARGVDTGDIAPTVYEDAEEAEKFAVKRRLMWELNLMDSGGLKFIINHCLELLKDDGWCYALLESRKGSTDC